MTTGASYSGVYSQGELATTGSGAGAGWLAGAGSAADMLSLNWNTSRHKLTFCTLVPSGYGHFLRTIAIFLQPSTFNLPTKPPKVFP